MRNIKLVFGMCAAIMMSSCGVEDKIEEAEQAIQDLEEYEQQLGADGVDQADVELALSELLDEELTDSDGVAISMSESDFSALGDLSGEEVAGEAGSITAEQEQDDPTIKMRRSAILDMIVEKIFEVGDADEDGFLDSDEFKNADFIGSGAKLPAFREVLFKAANAHCKDKDEDSETLHADEVRCIARRVIAHKVKKHYQAYSKEERKTKRDEKRLKRMKEFQKREIGNEGKDLTDEQKQSIKAKVEARKKVFEKKRSEMKAIREERQKDPDAYKKRWEEKKAAREAKKK